MAWRHGKPSRVSVKRSIHELMASFLTTYVIVKRRTNEFNEYGEQIETYHTVYDGKALVRPAGGTTETYGLGTVENVQLVILINGTFDIRQADVVTINDGREYEVMYPPEYFNAYTELRLTQRSQIGQPT